MDEQNAFGRLAPSLDRVWKLKLRGVLQTLCLPYDVTDNQLTNCSETIIHRDRKKRPP